MDTELSYEIVGGTLGALAVLIGIIGASRQRSRSNQETEALKTQLRSQVDALTQKDATYSETLMLSKSAVQELEKQIASSGEKLEMQEAEGLMLQKAIAAIQAEADQSKEQFDTLSAEQRTKEQTYTQQAEAQIAQLQTQLDTANAAQIELKAAQETAQAQQRADQANQKTLLNDLQQQQIDSITQQREALEQDLESQKSSKIAEEKALRSQIASLETQLNELAKATDQQSADLIDQQIQPLRKERDAAKQAEQESRLAMETLESQLKEAIAAQTVHQQEQATAGESLNTLRSRLKALEKHNESLRQSAEKAEGIGPLEEEVRSLSAELTQIQEKLAAQRATAEQNTTEHSQQIKTLKAERASLEEAMKISQQVIEAMQKQAASSAAQKSSGKSSGKSTQQKSASKASQPEKNKPTKDKPTEDKPTENKPQKSDVTATATEQAESQPADSPQGTDSLAGKIFVITGSLDQLTYEQITETVTSAGGRINKMPSSKTDYIVVGKNPGNKLKKAVKCNVPQLNESELITLFDSLG